MDPVYFYVLIVSISFPLLFTLFVKDYIVHWKAFVFSTASVAFLFLLWDAVFTEIGIWGFNSDYCLGLFMFGMPVEEYLFFLFIPFSSLFIHFILEARAPHVRLGASVTSILTLGLILVTFLISVANLSKLYTTINFAILTIILSVGYFFGRDKLRRFYVSFFIVLLPFFIVNGMLTGSFLEEPIVWYNDTHNLGIRLGTIPVEDSAYAFSMLFLNLFIFDALKAKFSKI